MKHIYTFILFLSIILFTCQTKVVHAVEYKQTNAIRMDRDDMSTKYRGEQTVVKVYYYDAKGNIDPNATFSIVSSDNEKISVKMLMLPNVYLITIPTGAPLGVTAMSITAQSGANRSTRVVEYTIEKNPYLSLFSFPTH